MAPEQLLESALSHVESASIRAWATSEHNKPIMLKLASGAIERAGVAGAEPNVHTFAAFIVASAIGL